MTLLHVLTCGVQEQVGRDQLLRTERCQGCTVEFLGTVAHSVTSEIFLGFFYFLDRSGDNCVDNVRNKPGLPGAPGTHPV